MKNLICSVFNHKIFPADTHLLEKKKTAVIKFRCARCLEEQTQLYPKITIGGLITYDPLQFSGGINIKEKS